MASQQGARTNAEWLELDDRFRLQAHGRTPIVLDRGEGVQVWDVEGKRYLDFESGQFCLTTGHCHPKVRDRISEQAGRLMQTGNRFTNALRIELAKKLAARSRPRVGIRSTSSSPSSSRHPSRSTSSSPCSPRWGGSRPQA